MIAAGTGGSLVTVTSMNGVAPGPNAGAYGATKAAVALLTRQMALEWGPAGIRAQRGGARADRRGHVRADLRRRRHPARRAGPRAARSARHRATTWPARCCSCCPTRPATSPAPSCSSTAGSPRASSARCPGPRRSTRSAPSPRTTDAEPWPPTSCISGGPLHDFAASTAALVERARGRGRALHRGRRSPCRARARWPSDPDALGHGHRQRAALADGGRAPRPPARTSGPSRCTTDEAMAIDRYVRGGGGLLALPHRGHLLRRRPAWAACLGATWNWDRSIAPAARDRWTSCTAAGRRVHPHHRRHRGVHHRRRGLRLPRRGRRTSSRCSPAAHGGADHPVLWARTGRRRPRRHRPARP